MAPLKVLDAHTHLPQNTANLGHAVDALLQEMETAGVEKCVLLHLINQPWDFREITACVRDNASVIPVVQMDPNQQDARDMLTRHVECHGARGLKIHPRLTPCSLAGKATTTLVDQAGKLDIPVVIDAFPSGDALTAGYYPTQYARLAEACPETSLVYAHMGGHFALDFMMMTKSYSNVHLDCSFSINYYNMDHIDQLFSKVISCTSPGKILFGSDYPFGGMLQSVEKAHTLGVAQSLSRENLEHFMYTSAESVFCK